VASWRARLALAAVLLLGVDTAAVDARSWAWLGVRIRDLSEQETESVAARHGIREGFGVVIVEVMEDTPAARAGMKNGDIVVAFDGRPVTETRMLQRLVAAAGADRDVRLTVLRPEGRRPLVVRLGAMPRPVAGERVAVEFGFTLRAPAARGEGPGPEITADTPAVAAVMPRTAASRAGLLAGDTILQINDRPVLTRESAGEVLADVDPETPLRLVVAREKQQLSLILTIAERG
jgi:serine protease Do